MPSFLSLVSFYSIFSLTSSAMPCNTITIHRTKTKPTMMIFFFFGNAAWKQKKGGVHEPGKWELGRE
jgi:hypothetical protein